MFISLFVCLFLVFFPLSPLGMPPGRFPESFIRMGSRYCQSKIMLFFLVCSFILCFSLFESSRDTTRKIFWKFHKHWTSFSRDIVGLKMFVCLFVCSLICLFYYFNHLGTPTGSYTENFVKIGLDLAEMMRILKMFICLFVCLFIYWFVCFFILIVLGHPQEVTLKVLWRSDLIWLRYLGS